ncbi:MAG: histidine phosphatase family protein [Dehalococcoidia bacterium]|nr:histidine phosphatase family protein [Dehalococcoidia bacterium]
MIFSRRRSAIKLYLIRHGETTWNQQRIIQGSGSDTDLSETGKAQAEKLGLKLQDVPLSAIYSSPLKRAMDTAGAIGRYHNLKIISDPGLMEVHVGEFEGMTLDKFASGFSQFMVDWQTRGESVSFNGGENLGEFKQRVWSSIKKIVQTNQEGCVAVVSHYFVTATIVCTALGLPITHMVRIRIQPSSQTMLEFEVGCEPRLLLLSDVCHLKEN